MMIEDLADVAFKPEFPSVTAAKPWESIAADAAKISAFVDQISRTQADSMGKFAERRASVRRPFPHLVRVTPWDRDRRTSLGDPLCVVGKHLSHEGFGFYHNSPLPFRYVVVEFESDNELTKYGLVLCLIWCRFLRDQWYDSGGKFTHVLKMPRGTDE